MKEDLERVLRQYVSLVLMKGRLRGSKWVRQFRDIKAKIRSLVKDFENESGRKGD